MTFNATLDFYFLSSSISFGKTLKSGTTIGGRIIFIAALALVIISQKSYVSILTNETNWMQKSIFCAHQFSGKPIAVGKLEEPGEQDKNEVKAETDGALAKSEVDARVVVPFAKSVIFGAIYFKCL